MLVSGFQRNNKGLFLVCLQFVYGLGAFFCQIKKKYFQTQVSQKLNSISHIMGPKFTILFHFAVFCFVFFFVFCFAFFCVCVYFAFSRCLILFQFVTPCFYCFSKYVSKKMIYNNMLHYPTVRLIRLTNCAAQGLGGFTVSRSKS